MRRLTIKGFKTAGFLLKAAASGIESLLEETYPVLRETYSVITRYIQHHISEQFSRRYHIRRRA